MNRRDDSHRIIDMLRYAELAIVVLDGDTLDQLRQNVVKSAALSKFVENVGEAAYKSEAGASNYTGATTLSTITATKSNARYASE